MAWKTGDGDCVVKSLDAEGARVEFGTKLAMLCRLKCPLEELPVKAFCFSTEEGCISEVAEGKSSVNANSENEVALETSLRLECMESGGNVGMVGVLLLWYELDDKLACDLEALKRGRFVSYAVEKG